jgi:hypothetical protein
MEQPSPDFVRELFGLILGCRISHFERCGERNSECAAG